MVHFAPPGVMVLNLSVNKMSFNFTFVRSAVVFFFFMVVNLKTRYILNYLLLSFTCPKDVFNIHFLYFKNMCKISILY